MASSITIGIDIGSYTTRVMIVRFEKTEDKIVPHIIGTGRSETRGVRRGCIVDMQEAIASIGKAVHDAEKSANMRIKRAHVTIGGTSLASHEGVASIPITKADGIITQLDIDRVIKECEKNISLTNYTIIESIPVEFSVDTLHRIQKPVGMKAKKLSAKTLFVTTITQHFDNLVHAVEQLGIDVIDVVAAPLSESLIVSTERHRTAGCAIVNVGAETTSVAVFENNTLLSLHIFAIGSSEITNDIALGLQVPLQEAEGIKVGAFSADVPRRKIDAIVDNRIIEIFEIVETHLQSIHRDQLLPGGVIITGGGSYQAQVELAARKVLRLPTTLGTAISNNLTRTTPLPDASWFVVYGLCMFARISSNGILTANPLKKILVDIKNICSNIFKQLTP